MNEEQQFKQQAWVNGLAHLNIQNAAAFVELAANIEETWRAKNEKSFFEKALDQIDNGFGAVGEKIKFKPKEEGYDGSKVNSYHADERLLWPHDNISGHKMAGPEKRNGQYDWAEISEYLNSRPDPLPQSILDLLEKTHQKSQKPVERWKPEYGMKYWVLDTDGEPLWFIWKGTPEQNAMMDLNTVFRTEQEALAARERVKAALQGE